MKELNYRFADRVRLLRLQHKYTQQELALLCGTDQSNISKIERGLMKGNLSLAISLARVFNTSIDYLIGLTDQVERH